MMAFWTNEGDQMPGQVVHYFGPWSWDRVETNGHLIERRNARIF